MCIIYNTSICRRLKVVISSYSHFNPDTNYYINLTSGTDIDAFNEEVKENLNFAGSISTTLNMESMIKGIATVYVSLMAMNVIAILVLSTIIITFVLYL